MARGSRCLLTPNPAKSGSPNSTWSRKADPCWFWPFGGSDDARALAVVAPLTSQIRGMRGEVGLGKPRWLPKHSAVNVQGLASFDHRKLTRRPKQAGEPEMLKLILLTGYPEFGVRKETICNFFSPPMPSITFHDRVSHPQMIRLAPNRQLSFGNTSPHAPTLGAWRLRVPDFS